MQVAAQKIVLLGTGGTIAGTAAQSADHVGYAAGQLDIGQLVATAGAAAGSWLLECEQVAQLDSKDMDHAVWAQLAARCAAALARDDVRAVVVTHGTDTLEETAFFLQRTLVPAKPLVLTCAMRPATAVAPDGPQNLLDALATAADARAAGVLVVCAGAIHDAALVRKVHTYRLDAFGCGDAGPVGYVEQAAVRWLRASAAAAGDAPAVPWPLPAPASWPRVEIVASHAGAGGTVVELLVRSGVHGIVVAATGNGTVHRDLEAALLRAEAAGVRVLRATRCAAGRIVPRPGDTLAEAGQLTPAQARVALLLDLLARP